jgi:hypothetical protein
MIAEAPTNRQLAEKQVRKQIDRSVARALFDGDYASLLLSDPTVALEDQGCPPQQFKSLRNIQALDITDFAKQAQALFWLVDPNPSSLEAQLPLAATVAR